MRANKVRRWLLFCEPCSYRRILEEGIKVVDLVEIPTSPIPGGSPKFDPATKKVKSAKVTDRNKKYKCPQCGRGIVSKELPEVYSKALSLAEKAEMQKLEDKRKKIQEERSKTELEQIGEKDETQNNAT